MFNVYAADQLSLLIKRTKVQLVPKMRGWKIFQPHPLIRQIVKRRFFSITNWKSILTSLLQTENLLICITMRKNLAEEWVKQGWVEQMSKSRNRQELQTIEINATRKRKPSASLNKIKKKIDISKSCHYVQEFCPHLLHFPNDF